MIRTTLFNMRRQARRLAGDRSGSAAIEFAMLAPAFFALLFAMFEIGITYFAGALLQDAVNDAARQIRTGQTQGAGLNEAQFREQVCDSLAVLLDCDHLILDVQANASFSGGGGTAVPTTPVFRPGVACEVVVVRAFYRWDVLTPWLGDLLLGGVDSGPHFMESPELGNEQHLIRATAAIRNEPFGQRPC